MAITHLYPLTNDLPENISRYASGQNKNYHTIRTTNVKNAALKQGHLPFYAGAWFSDHGPIYIDINILLLFGSTSHDIAPNPKWKLSSKHIKNII
jgi:hypothetical protein